MTETALTKGWQARVEVENAKKIYLSQEMTAAVRADALASFEAALDDVNEAFADGTDTHEQIGRVLAAVDDAAKYADVVYWLTPLDDEDESA